ncbi:DNA modification methylase [Brevundimonas nasdae]|uniref:DNA-methyltransferase n=1 Tax=Brevundimonas nasdae TaxID=172043 RepID=UPI0019115689|nr:site-specific DNA-methyltransferase [Brevundimonas nasdae]MBK6023668.1 site-specific DNA-methyltransferase [Brevundimonas nasdae]MDQ0450320.1 DNA modification methylase [Brevundimonas nasdae]
MLREPAQSTLGEGKILQGDVLKALKSVETGSVDLVVSSPPYNIGKIYERDQTRTLEEYKVWQTAVVDAVCEKIKTSGSVCWQVGSYIKNGEVYPLDIMFYDLFKKNGFKLRNRIIWRFNFGLNSDRRFSGRYETVLWFTKSDEYKFNLDPVRVPQLYPGKRHSKSKGVKAGLPSGNPRGKNPSDYWEFSAEKDFLENPVWEIPNVKANHPEKTEHPCQFPIELAERCVLALSEPGDLVLDPFVGTGAAVLAAVKQNRRAVGIDRDPAFVKLARARLKQLAAGNLPVRPLGRPVSAPSVTQKVALVPEEWLEAS